MKKLIVLLNFLLILMLTACKGEEYSPTPDETIVSAVLKSFNLFPNVINNDTFILEDNFNGQAIKWEYDTAYITKNGNNYHIKKDGTVKLKAIIDNFYDDNYTLEIKNKAIKSLKLKNLKINYAFITDSKKIGPQMTPTIIVFHNTANTASSYNEVMYLASKANNSSTSFHFAVDDQEIWQAIPLTNASFHAGNYEINCNSIGIEIAKSMLSDNKIKDIAINNALLLINLLSAYYQITIDNIIPHKEASGKYCPHDLFDRNLIDSFYFALNELKNENAFSL